MCDVYSKTSSDYISAAIDFLVFSRINSRWKGRIEDIVFENSYDKNLYDTAIDLEIYIFYQIKKKLNCIDCRLTYVSVGNSRSYYSRIYTIFRAYYWL